MCGHFGPRHFGPWSFQSLYTGSMYNSLLASGCSEVSRVRRFRVRFRVKVSIRDRCHEGR